MIWALLRGDFISLQSWAFQRTWGSTDSAVCTGRGVGNCTVLCQSVDPSGQSNISKNPQTLCVSEPQVASALGRSRDAAGGQSGFTSEPQFTPLKNGQGGITSSIIFKSMWVASLKAFVQNPQLSSEMNRSQRKDRATSIDIGDSG